MTGVVMLTLGNLFGLAPTQTVILALVLFWPWPAAVGVAVAIFYATAKNRAKNSTADFCVAVSSELKAGAGLRHALASGWASNPPPLGGLLEIDEGVAAVARQLGHAYPDLAQELELAIPSVSVTGSDAALVFDELAALALATAETRSEVRMASAPGLATAALLIGAPVVYLTAQLAAGRIPELLRSPQQRVVTVLGMTLFSLGCSWALAVLWRSRS